MTDEDNPAGGYAPRLSVLMVSHGTKAMTLVALDSLARTTRVPHEVIVIDNASADGSVAAIRAAHPAVRLIEAERNLGFGLAVNLAARHHARGDYLLLLNTDVVVLPGAVEALLDCAVRRPEALIWGGRTLFADGRLNPTSVWRRPTLFSLAAQATGLSKVFRGRAPFDPEAYPGWARDDEREVDIIAGCLFLIGRATWNRLGGFDPAFTMYGEEADLCLRARRDLGARPLFTPRAQIVHHGGGSAVSRARQVAQISAARIGLARRHMATPARQAAVVCLRATALVKIAAAGLGLTVPPERGGGIPWWRGV